MITQHTRSRTSGWLFPAAILFYIGVVVVVGVVGTLLPGTAGLAVVLAGGFGLALWVYRPRGRAGNRR